MSERSVPCGGQRMTLTEYLNGPETNKRYELVYGVVREPAAPSWDHQRTTLRLATVLEQHVRRLNLGQVGVSPIDVVLDEDQFLIVQPDVVVITSERSHIVRGRVWGAPDLVVEVLSPSTHRYDRYEKRDWYRQYGVRERWLVDPWSRSIEIGDLSVASSDPVRFSDDEVIRSTVLPRLRVRVSRLLQHGSTSSRVSVGRGGSTSS